VIPYARTVVVMVVRQNPQFFATAAIPDAADVERPGQIEGVLYSSREIGPLLSKHDQSDSAEVSHRCEISSSDP
jgi:hypothetical protein